MPERILVVAPSWVGDAILCEPLIARLRDTHDDGDIDVLTPSWCAPVFARMRGVRRVIDSALEHGDVALSARRELARSLRRQGYSHAVVLPNSWKSALVPWFAGIPHRAGYLGEARWGLVNDVRSLDAKALPRLVDRYVALAGERGAPPSQRLRPCSFPIPSTAMPQ
jgi:heptosyltransferase-2